MKRSDCTEREKIKDRKIMAANIRSNICVIIPSRIKTQHRHAALTQSILFHNIAQYIELIFISISTLRQYYA